MHFFFVFCTTLWQVLTVWSSTFAPSNKKTGYDSSKKWGIVLQKLEKLTNTQNVTIMQLEFNFNQKDLQTNAQEFFSNMYSILIWMQILAQQA